MRLWIRFALCLALALLPATQPARAASDWQVIKVGRWDYLTVDNIAKFYGFAGEVGPTGKTIRIDNGRNSLEVTLDSREAIINGVRNWLCFPVIQHPDGKFLVSRIDLAKTIEPQFRPHMIANLGRLKTVVLDAGHGGIEKGAGSSYGHEKEFTLDVARQLKPLLEAKGLRVIMTRNSDDVVPLPTRARIANATKDSIFVSIHFNATDANPHATGFEIYSLTPRGAPSTQDNKLLARFARMQAGSPVDAASLALSTSVYHAMLGYMPEFDRGIKRARFAVLRLTQVPAILVEGGFMSERQESRLIAKPEWRAKLAQAISVGIENYKNLIEKKQRPMMLADYRRQLEGVLVARDANARPAPTTAAPPVFAASNQEGGLIARLTNALRREPSPQISLNETASETEPEEEHSTAPAPAAGAPPASEPAQPPEEPAAAAAPPIFPAANVQPPAPDAQFTNTLRNEPSDQIALNQTPAANAPVAPHEDGDATGSASPAAPPAGDAQQVAKASDEAAEMPAAPEPAPVINANGDKIDPPPPGEGPTPAAKLTIWQKIARQLPLPKFRQ
ncbi:MAG: N-acetylmuramoyl-L-alanine amidase [Chthoniobacterales bacterium]